MAAGSKKKAQVPKQSSSQSSSNKKKRRSKKSPSPNPSQDPILPPPSSITPSRSSARTRKGSKTTVSSSSLSNNPAHLSSPLASKQTSNQIQNATQSSPIRPTKLNSLPSPSPDSHQASQSSPTKNRKKVMFNDGNLTNFNHSSPVVPSDHHYTHLHTPTKSILKPTTRPPLMSPLLPQTSLHGSLVNPSQLDFWTPGNIPRLANPNSLNEELIFFKNVIHGGISVLDLPNCDKQFEIYATINLLLKDLTDKKILVLLGLLPELIRLVKKDTITIENQILNSANSDPFLVRTSIQITKIITQLISNVKIMNTFWKKSRNNFDFVKWSINHSSSLILKPTISKSLLTANLQLIKDHKIHQYLSVQTQEYILYSLLNMKYFNSSSLLVERLYTLKSLIINSTLTMEKNAKSWLPFLFNCLCDFNSPMYQKQQQVAVQCLLESSKLFITSKTLNFEIKSILHSPIHKTLNIAPESQPSLDSSSLDLHQTTWKYITLRTMELVKDQPKIAMDLWLGLTLLIYNDPAYLAEYPIEETEWYSVLKYCFQQENQETKMCAIRAFKGLVYVLAKNIRVMESGKLNEQKVRDRLFLMFGIIRHLGEDYEDVDMLVNSYLQIFYSVLNNPMNGVEVIKCVFDQIMVTLHSFKRRSEYLEKVGVRIFTHLVSGFPGTQAQQHRQGIDSGFYLMKCLSTDRFELSEVNGFSGDVMLELYESIFAEFIELVWNSKESLKVKVNCLSSLLNSYKPVAPKENDLIISAKISRVINQYAIFFTRYLDTLNDLTAAEKLEYINKFILIFKTTFGYRMFYKVVDDQIVFDYDNIFVNVINLISKREDVKVTDVLKFTITLIKSFQYKFFEGLVLNEDNTIIRQYLVNNFESKIFENSMAIQDVQSLGNIIAHLPKSKLLLANYISYILKNSITNGINFLHLKIWRPEDLILLSDLISDEVEQLRTTLIQELNIVLRNISVTDAIKIFKHWWTRDNMVFLVPFQEHIYFHVLGPNNNRSHETSLDLLAFLQKYLKLIDEKHSDYLDEFISQGLELCAALRKDGVHSTTVSRVETSLFEWVSRIGVDKLEKCKKYKMIATSVASNINQEDGPSDLSLEDQEAKNIGDEIDIASNSPSINDIGGKDTVEIQNCIDTTGEVDETHNEIAIASLSADLGDASEVSQENEDAKESNKQSKSTPDRFFDENSTQIKEEDKVEQEAKDTIVEDSPTQVIENTDTIIKNNVQKSSSIELTSDWNECPSSDHEFFDARANIDSSPVKNGSIPDDSAQDNPVSDDKFYDSHSERSPIVSEELIEPVNQVVETQEISESNENPQPCETKESQDEVKQAVVNEKPNELEQMVDEEKENEIPSDSFVLYSSPMKNIKRKLRPLSIRVNDIGASPVKNTQLESVETVGNPDEVIASSNALIEKFNEKCTEVGKEQNQPGIDAKSHTVSEVDVEEGTEEEGTSMQDVEIPEEEVGTSQSQQSQTDADHTIEQQISPGHLNQNEEIEIPRLESHPGEEKQACSDEEEDDEYDIIEIDNSEFTQSIRESSSPKKRSSPDMEEKELVRVNKKICLDENSSSLDVPGPLDPLPVLRPIDQIDKVFGGFTDEQIKRMDDKEVFEMENKLLAFMMRMRTRNQ